MAISRKVLIAGSVVAVAGVSCLAAALYAPHAVRNRVLDAGRQRGFDLTVDDVDLGLAETTITGIAGTRGPITFDVRSVSIDSNILSLASSGLGPSTKLNVSGATAIADLTQTTEGGDVTQTKSSGSSLDFNVKDVAITLKDSGGDLLTTRGNIAISNGRINAELQDISVGAAPGHEFTFKSVELDVSRAPTQVHSMEVREGRVLWGYDSTTEEPNNNSDLDTFLRLRRAQQALFPSKEDVGGETTNEGSDSLSKLAEKVSIVVADVDVQSRTGKAWTTVLKKLNASLTGSPAEGTARAFKTSGKGKTDLDGELVWDFDLIPEQAKGEGTLKFEALPLALIAPLLPNVPWHQPERARLQGQLMVKSDNAAGKMSFDGNVALRNGALLSARVAPDPVFLGPLSFEGSGSFDPLSSQLELATSTLTVNRAKASIAGSAQWDGDHYATNMVMNLPPTHCGDAVGAIPDDLLRDIAGFAWSGRFGARIDVKVDSNALKDTDLRIHVADGCRFSTVPGVADLRRFQAPFLHRVTGKTKAGEEHVFEINTGPGTNAWSPINQISPYIVHAIVGHEDGGFFSHQGFSRHAVRDSLVRNLEAGRYVRGASTISMQLAKNLFLKREKTLSRKVQEIILTWWLETQLDKRALIELYLNVIEYGPGIYGIRNAAKHYFGRKPADLSPAEASFLACVLPNPPKFHKHYENGSLSAKMTNRVRRFMTNMHKKGRFKQAALDFGLAELKRGLQFSRGGKAAQRVVPKAYKLLPFQTDEVVIDDDGLLDPFADDASLDGP